MSYVRALNFDQWKPFSKNYKPVKIWVWLCLQMCWQLLSLETFLPVHSKHNVKGIQDFVHVCHIFLISWKLWNDWWYQRLLINLWNHLNYTDYFKRIPKFGLLIVEKHALLNDQIENRINLKIFSWDTYENRRLYIILSRISEKQEITKIDL